MKTIQRKHITQMSRAEQSAVAQAVNGVAERGGFYVAQHVWERACLKNVAEGDIKQAITSGRVIEVNQQPDGEVRVLLRHDGQAQAVCVVVSLSRRSVVTVWKNELSDTHNTLRRELYQWQVFLTGVLPRI